MKIVMSIPICNGHYNHFIPNAFQQVMLYHSELTPFLVSSLARMWPGLDQTHAGRNLRNPDQPLSIRHGLI